MRIDKSGIGDSIISYKGHGMIETASRLNSIGHVIAHENRHLQQYRNRAMYQGKEITSEDITVKYEFRDGVLVAVAGEAKATMRDKPEDTSEQSDVLEVARNQPVDTNADIGNEENNKKQKLDILLTRIDAALNKLDSKLGESEKESESGSRSENGNLAQLRQKRVELEQKRKEINNKKNKLNAEKLNELTEQLLEGLSDLTEQASKLMKSIYGLKTGKQIEQNPDNSNELEVPDYSMLYTGMLLDTMIY